MILLGRRQVIDLKHLSRRTGLIVRTVDADSMATLFDVSDDYDVNERAEPSIT